MRCKTGKWELRQAETSKNTCAWCMIGPKFCKHSFEKESFFFLVLAGSFRWSIFVAPNALKVTDQLEFLKKGAKKKDPSESHPAVSHQRACQLWLSKLLKFNNNTKSFLLYYLILLTLPVKSFWTARFFDVFKEASAAHQGCIQQRTGQMRCCQVICQ